MLSGFPILCRFDHHLDDLHLSFERMRRYGLQMNSLKCAFCVGAGKFLGFIIHEQSIEIDLKKVESIRKLEEPKCKRGVEKLLGKLIT